MNYIFIRKCSIFLVVEIEALRLATLASAQPWHLFFRMSISHDNDHSDSRSTPHCYIFYIEVNKKGGAILKIFSLPASFGPNDTTVLNLFY